MKKTYWLAACLSFGLIVACGGSEKGNSANNKEVVAEVKTSVEPVADSEQTSEIAFTLGGHKYQVNIHRYSDKTLPLIVDELEQQFYDNSVEIKVLRDGDEFLSKKVTKEAFAEFLSEGDYKSGMLLGMNCDTLRSDVSSLCFTAQVGQAGEGPAFLILVPTNGGAISVMRDNLQEEIGYKE